MCFGILLTAAVRASAQGCESLTSLGVPVPQDFSTLATTGTSSTTPLGWNFTPRTQAPLGSKHGTTLAIGVRA